MLKSLHERRALADAAVKHSRWMIRADNDGVSPNKKPGGFRWPEPGEWIKAADFNTRAECGGGLHGQDRTWGGYGEGRRLVFCEWRGGYVGGIDGNKMKVEEARILLVGELPAGLICDGSLGLSGCDLKGIALPWSVGGWLYLNSCELAGIALPQSVGGALHLSGCDLTGVTLPRSVGGSLDVSGCDLRGIALPRSVGGSIDLSGCDLTGITLPQAVGGSIDLSGCDLTGITLPQAVGGSIDLSGCDLTGITLPRSVGGALYRKGCATSKASSPAQRLRSKGIHYLSSLYEGARKPCHN
jgi:Pentapeptide repeats (8 copies)